MASSSLRIDPALPLLPHLLLLLLLLLLLADSATAKKKKPISFPGILPHISCQVCNEAVKHMHRQVKAKQAGQSFKMTEDSILEVVERSCDALRKEGRWIRHLDIQPTDEGLKLVEMPHPGKCEKKCSSIQEACSAVIESSDLSGMIYKGKGRAKLAEYMCRDGADTGEYGPCHKKYKIPKLSAKLLEAVKGEKFSEVDSKELEAEKMMTDMGDTGIPREAFKLYSRDNIDEMAIDEMVKSGMDEDEAAEMVKKMKEEMGDLSDFREEQL